MLVALGQVVTGLVLMAWIPVAMAVLMLLSDDPHRTASPWPPLVVLLYPALLGVLYYVRGWRFLAIPPAIFLGATIVVPGIGAALLAWAVITSKR